MSVPARAEDGAHRAATQDEVDAWAASGAMELTGRRDGPALGPPAGLVSALSSVAAVLRRRSCELGAEVDLDPLALLGERAALAGLRRNGGTSCGGATRLLPAADGWLAVSLARPDDLDLLPAWLGLAGPAEDAWDAVTAAVARRTATEAAADGALLGLPVAALPLGVPRWELTSAPSTPLPLRGHLIAERPGPTADLAGIRVVDLSALWAGPLCGSLLALAGADVVKVESAARPDGARLGPTALFDLLNGDKRSVALDLRTEPGRADLLRLVRAADVVIEASRPRALAQLGIRAEDVLREGRPRVWLSITGHGRSPEVAHRVGFGDDAAVGGGLVSWDGEVPCFTADAVADPAAGLVAAAAVLDALATGGRWLLDVALTGVAAHLAGPTLPTVPRRAPVPPRARTSHGPARPFGADTASVLAELDGR
jgi:crotonobetainyl-CoA:carnitine CoA-transferase CaiB-like acyl-CoA transferase